MRNLKAEMIRKGITVEDLAKVLNKKPETIRAKFASKINFTLEQAFVIQEEFFPEYSIEYLFRDKG